MTRTSHKKNRPFDFKLISLVKPHPVLYQRHWGGLSTFECMKEKNRIWNTIAVTMGASTEFCLSRWNNLRNHFQRELRHCTELCPKEGIIKGSTWPYLESMRFLETTVRSKKTHKPLPLIKEEENIKVADICSISELSSNDGSQNEHEFEEFEEMTDEILVNDRTEADESNENRFNNFQRMAKLLRIIPNEHKPKIERRILAYLCKCQLRAITNEPIEDITI